MAGKSPIVKVVIENYTEEMSQDELDQRLIEAASNGQLQAVKGYLANQANPNAPIDPEKPPSFGRGMWRPRSALMWAVIRGHKEIVEILLESGAKPNTRNGSNETAMSLAVDFDDLDIIRVLHARGGDLNAVKGSSTESLLMDVLVGRRRTSLLPPKQRNNVRPRLDTARLLVELDADLNHVGYDNNTALIYAAGLKPDKDVDASRILELVRLMVEKGANVYAKNKKGENALERAEARLNGPAANYLKQYMNEHPQPPDPSSRKWGLNLFPSRN